MVYITLPWLYLLFLQFLKRFSFKEICYPLLYSWRVLTLSLLRFFFFFFFKTVCTWFLKVFLLWLFKSVPHSSQQLIHADLVSADCHLLLCVVMFVCLPGDFFLSHSGCFYYIRRFWLPSKSLYFQQEVLLLGLAHESWPTLISWASKGGLISRGLLASFWLA